MFENVFLALEEGEKTGIVGRNGAGKSTFLRCLMGLTALDEGTVSMKKGTEAVLLEQNVTYPEGTTLSGFLYLQQSRAVRMLADYQKALDEGNEKEYTRLSAIIEKEDLWDTERRYETSTYAPSSISNPG